MKRSFFLPVSILLSAIIVFCGLFYLTATIERKVFNSSFPSSIDVNTINNEDRAGDFLSFEAAARYIGIYDNLAFHELLEKGSLDGTFTSHKASGSTTYIFSKSKLNTWMLQKIENGMEIN